MPVRRVEVVVRSYRNVLLLPLQLCDSRMFVKENPDRKKNKKCDWQKIYLKSVTDFADCKLMLSMSLRDVLLFQMWIFCKCKISSKYQSVKLSTGSSRFLMWYIAKEILWWYSVLGYEANNPNFSLEKLLIKINKLKQNNLQWFGST